MKCCIEMYRIRQEDVRIKIPCESCLEKGIVDKNCCKCGGNGVHKKTIKVWKVAPRTVTVEKIDRETENWCYKGVQYGHIGELRYWYSYSEFYSEESKLLHFNKEDAQEECNRRNVEIADILKIHDRNKQNTIYIDYDDYNVIVMALKAE